MERAVDFIVLRGEWGDGSIPLEDESFFKVALGQMAGSIFNCHRWHREEIASYYIKPPRHIESIQICMEKMSPDEFYSKFLEIINEEYRHLHPRSFEAMNIIRMDNMDASNKTFGFVVGNSRLKIEIISVGMIHWEIKDQMRGATEGRDVLRITSQFVV